MQGQTKDSGGYLVKGKKGVNMPESDEVFSLISRRTNRPEYSSDGFIRNLTRYIICIMHTKDKTT